MVSYHSEEADTGTASIAAMPSGGEEAMKKLRPDQEAELAKGLAAKAEWERRRIEKGITREEELAASKQFQEDCIYASEIYDELVKQYPNLYVAVYRKEIIAVGAIYKEVLKQASSIVRPPGSFATKFVDPDPPYMVVTPFRLSR